MVSFLQVFNYCKSSRSEIPNNLNSNEKFVIFAAIKDSIMRALTGKEKRFCEALLKNEERSNGQKSLGEVIQVFFGVDFFKKD